MEVRDVFGENLPGLDLQRTRDALAAYVALRWPVGRRKAVMKEWGLNEDEARSVTGGRASWATFDKILLHPRGQWAVALPIMGAVIGHGVEDFLLEQRKRHADLARRHGALVRDLRAGPAAYRPRAREHGPDPVRRDRHSGR